MRKKKMAIMAIVFTAALMVGILPAKIALADTYGMTGSGTAADPYIITTATQLENIDNVSLSAYYRLGNNINCDADGIANWVPIGSTSAFTGTLDGKGYTFSYPSGAITSWGSGAISYFGIFRAVSGATIKNLTISLNSSVSVDTTGYYLGSVAALATNSTFSHITSNISIDGLIYIGGIVGSSLSSTFNYCTNNGNLSSLTASNLTDLGGIVGSSCDDAFNSCSNHGKLTVLGSNVGGIAGTAQGSSFISCYNTGNLGDSINSAAYFQGGIVGELYSDSTNAGVINKCYNTGNIYGSRISGGIVSDFSGMAGSTVANCYSSGNYTTYGESGGIVGELYSVDVYNCFSTATVTEANSGSDPTGGIVGDAFAPGNVTTIQNCYFAGYSSGGGIYGYSLNSGYTVILKNDRQLLNSSRLAIWESSVPSGKTVYAPSDYSSSVSSSASWCTSNSASSSLVSFLNSNLPLSSVSIPQQSWLISASINNGYPYLVGVGPDITPPTGSYSLSKSTWTCKSVTITVTATDSGSGVASITLPDNTVVSAVTANYTVTDNGTYNFVLADNAGNTCTYPVTVSNIDRNVSVTHEQTVAYTIDPNSSSLSGGTITLTNNDPHIGVAVYLSSLTSSGISAVAPDAAANWNALNAAQTASSMAIAVGVSNATDTKWYSVARSAPAYSTDLASPVLIGVINPGSSVTLVMTAKYGLAWASQKSVTHTLALSYQACDTD